jgi:hypothetical protein
MEKVTGKYPEWTRGEDEALLNKLGGVDAARMFIRDSLIRGHKCSKPKKLLRHIGTRGVPEVSPALLNIRKFLQECRVIFAESKLEDQFLHSRNIIIPRRALDVHHLVAHDVRHYSIMNELNLAERGEVDIFQFICLLSNEAGRTSGHYLDIYSRVSLAYVVDNDGLTQAVQAQARQGFESPDSPFWVLSAHPVGIRSGWGSGVRLVSQSILE